MKKLLGVIIVIFGLWIVSAFAVDFTISLTQEQVDALVWAKNKYNNEHSTSLTNLEFFNQVIIGTVVENYQEQMEKEEREALKEAYAAADQATKDQIKTLLGIE